MKYVTINGRRWTVSADKVLSENWGECEHDNHVIRICSTALKDQKRILRDTLLHEYFHARWPWMREFEVAEAAAEAEAVLDKFGV